MINLGKNCNLNIEKLIATRMLINANSGGGKSWAIRRFLEKSHGQVQQIVLDLEGEFISLREEYDYLLVGKEGEIPASIRTAEILAKRLLELNVSTVIDLSELKHPERITFVKRFLDSLINSPKNLWHPVIIIVDEAHQFCPEKSKSESMNAVIDLMTRGRKRGFCGVLATQRISKLHKDAAAECNNQMVGRTGLDIDMKRAGDILGFTSKADVRSLKDLREGEFYVYGSAFEHSGIGKIMVGGVKTTHPDRTKGIQMDEVLTTPENIKKIMDDIGDLPKEAEEELRTVGEMKSKIRELRTKLTIAERDKAKPEIDQEAMNIAIQRARVQTQTETMKLCIGEQDKLKKTIKILEKKIVDVGKIVDKEVTLSHSQSPSVPPLPIIKPSPMIKVSQVTPMSNPPVTPVSDGERLKAGAMKMLGWLAGAHPQELTKQRIATLSGFSVKGGTFGAYISGLKKNGWIVGSNEFAITEEGLENAEPMRMPTGEELLSLWKTKFKRGAGEILQFLYESYPNEVSRDEIGEVTGFEPSGGTFGAYLSVLRRNGLIEVNEGVKISDEFFE